MLRVKKKRGGGLRKQNVVGHRFDNIQGIFPSFESLDTVQRAPAHWKCKCTLCRQREQTPSPFLSFHHLLLLCLHFALFHFDLSIHGLCVWEKRQLAGGCVQRYWGLWNIYQSNNDSLDRVSGGRRRGEERGKKEQEERNRRVRSACLLFRQKQGWTKAKEADLRLSNFSCSLNEE